MTDRAVGGKRALLLLCPFVRDGLHFQGPFASFEAVQRVCGAYHSLTTHMPAPARLFTRLQQENRPRTSGRATAASMHAREGKRGGGHEVGPGAEGAGKKPNKALEPADQVPRRSVQGAHSLGIFGQLAGNAPPNTTQAVCACDPRTVQM